MRTQDFLETRGVSVEWLEELSESMLNDPLGSNDTNTSRAIVALLAEMIEAPVTLPPRSAELVTILLRDMLSGADPRARLGLKPGRGRPSDQHIEEKHQQAEACLLLLHLAKVPKTIAVQLVAAALPLDERHIWNLEPDEIGETCWAQVPYYTEVALGEDGKGVLCRLLERPPPGADNVSRAWWQKFREFVPVR
jgi:hypothetical protein